MKTYGLLETQKLLSIVTDENGDPRLDTISPRGQYHMGDLSAPWNGPGALPYDPADYPGLLWTPPAMVELTKLPRPDTAPGKTADPVLVWTETSVTRDWEVRDMIPAELADSIRKTWPTSQAFLAEFTIGEMAGIGLSSDPTIAALRLMLSVWSGQIFGDDERVVTGLAALHIAGILTAERRAQILAK